jgi:hypothetical protein
MEVITSHKASERRKKDKAKSIAPILAYKPQVSVGIFRDIGKQFFKYH